MWIGKAFSLWKTAREVARFEKGEKNLARERFYADPAFREIDRALQKAYRFENPYRVSRKYWRDCSYGETPLSVLELLGKAAGLCPSDVFVDLGCGRGRGVFFLRQFFGCRAVGIEAVPAFVRKAKKIQEQLKVDRLVFEEKDLNALTEVEGTVFYAAWTCFDEELTARMVRFFESLPKGVRVITVSEPLESAYYRVTKTINASFAWGKGEIYIHERT